MKREERKTVVKSETELPLKHMHSPTANICRQHIGWENKHSQIHANARQLLLHIHGGHTEPNYQITEKFVIKQTC